MVLTKKEYDLIFGDMLTKEKDPKNVTEFKGITISSKGLHKQNKND